MPKSPCLAARKSGPLLEISLSSSAAFRAHLAVCLHKMGYNPCPANPDPWLKEQTDQKGNHYYAYILCYVDDLLVVHQNPRGIMDKIDSFLSLKPDLIGPPEMYLGQSSRRKPLKMELWHSD
ncbi:hypothetical protein ACHAW6_005326 [Cyclotella cf. meneghiniana]